MRRVDLLLFILDFTTIQTRSLRVTTRCAWSEMFRKRANLRGGSGGKKAQARDDDDDEPGILSAPAVAKSSKGGTDDKEKKSKKPAAKAALLSFEDEETDAEVFQVKKSKTKNKSMRAPDARGDVGDTQTTTSSAGGAYSSQALRELQEAQKSLGARPSEHLDPNAPVEIKLRGTLKASGATGLIPPPSRDPVCYVPPPPPRPSEVGGASANFAPPAVDVEMADIAVPDAAAIIAAKAQREEMRAAGSRGVGSTDVTMGDADVIAEADGGEWEDQQLRKAMSVRGAAPVPKTNASRGASGARSANSLSTAEDIVAGGVRALTSLRLGVSRAGSTSRAAGDELKRAEASLASSASMLEMYKERLSLAGERYAFVQELRDYFRDLCQCLHDKDHIIQELETVARQLHETRGASAAKAAATDVADELAEAEAAVEAAQHALMRGASREEAAVEAQAAAERALPLRFSDESKPAELDELGRDVGAARRSAAARRATARRALRAAESTSGTPFGEADDAEDAEEVGLFRKGWLDAKDAAACVMRDAGAEYASIAPVKAKAEDWKRRFPKTYKDAWMSHAAPTLFAPFVRLELLSWSPLFLSGVGDGPAPPLDDMAWYSELLEYGAVVDPEDPDGNMVPTLVEKLAAPAVAHAVESSWDPSSVEQSRRLAGVTKDLLVYLDPESCDAMARVLASTARRLHETAEMRCDIPGWAPVATAAAPVAAAHVRRQFGVALRCMRAATAWTGILPTSDVAAVARDAIVAHRIAPHLRLALARPGECLDSLERVAAVVPREWLESVRGVAATLGQLVRASPETHTAAAAALDPTGTVDPSKLVKVLAAVGEFDEAAAVAKLFGVSAKEGAR